jgi:hypothetical protein
MFYCIVHCARGGQQTSEWEQEIDLMVRDWVCGIYFYDFCLIKQEVNNVFSIAVYP